MFDKKWCDSIVNLYLISVSPLNNSLGYVDSSFIISKSDPKNEKYDALLFVNRKVKEFAIPKKVISLF